jgi:hypothetical protein
MFRRFGSRVTIVQSRGQLLAGEDADVAEAVTAILREEGIEVLLNAKAVRVAGGSGSTTLFVECGGKNQEIVGSHLLVATGRVPNSDSLNLQAAGITTDARGFIRVDEKLETNAAGVYAYFVRRFSDLAEQRAGEGKRLYGTPHGALHNVYRPAVGPRGNERNRSAEERKENSRGKNGDGLRSPRSGSG